MAFEESSVLQYVQNPPPVLSARPTEFSVYEHGILDAVNQKVAAAETLDEMLNFIFEMTHNICPCDRLGLAFVDQEGDQAVAVANWSRAVYDTQYLKKGYAEFLNDSSLKSVLDSGHTRVINDLELYFHSRPQSQSTRLILREGICSSLTCPLIVENRNVGFLFRSSLRPNTYNGHLVKINRAMAERLGQAVEKARRIEQLEEANRAYNEVLGFVSHELKSPLTSLIMDAETLLGDYLGPLKPEQRSKIQQMVDKSSYLLELIRRYLNLARLEGGRFKPSIQQNANLFTEALEPAINLVRGMIEKKGIHLEVPQIKAPVLVDCDPELLKIVLVNLLGNAAKYGTDKGEIRVRVEWRDDYLQVAVWNRGPGFPDTERFRLFQRFSRVQTPELMKHAGTGVGLYTSWRIIQLHNGRIWAESEEGQWAEFLFEIPRSQPEK
ncbi:MAG: GAF domain-containing sensor histidine kinase [Candidatus Sumerlaeota bacterium]|nr:GAF domain-containing sensor histidine kinase [Candidatus Sumerlaeota bacterium]